MASERDTKSNPPRPHEPAPTPVPVLPDMVQPEPQLNRPIPRAPAEDYLHEVLMPAFVLMVFGACFIINPMAAKGHGSSAAQDEALLAFCVFWLGAVSLLCRRLLVARLPALANAPACIVRFAKNCIFGPAPDP